MHTNLQNFFGFRKTEGRYQSRCKTIGFLFSYRIYKVNICMFYDDFVDGY